MSFSGEYWSFREELSVEDGLLFKSERLVAPRPLRAKMLDEIHGAHIGENKSICFARDFVFWFSVFWSLHLPETDQPASSEAEVPIKFTVDAHRSPITTRSGRRVKKPERIIESC